MRSDPDMSAALARMRWAGVILDVRDGGLAVTAETPLTDRQARFIGAHKDALVAILTAEARDRGLARLEALALELAHPLEDLVDWFAPDLADFGNLPAEQVEWIVRNYVLHRDAYRGPHGPALRFQSQLRMK